MLMAMKMTQGVGAGASDQEVGNAVNVANRDMGWTAMRRRKMTATGA